MDATIVRALLVPAFMKIAGRANWWAPAPLRRLHDRFGISEADADPDSESDGQPDGDKGSSGRLTEVGSSYRSSISLNSSAWVTPAPAPTSAGSSRMR